MRTTLKRATTAAMVAAGVAAGTLAGTGASQAATPGDLQITGNVECHFGQWGQPWNKAWYMYRWMTVRNIGGSTMHNVNLHEINGKSVYIKELKPGQTMSKWSKKDNRWIRPIETRWTGCFPSSISGYTIGAEAENLANNFGYWRNDRTI